MTPTPSTLQFAVLATDVATFRLYSGRLEVLLIKVVNPDFAGMEGLPGGLIAPAETAEESAVRHLCGKGGLERAYMEQLYTFSDVERDPRGRVVSVAHLALLPSDAVRFDDRVARNARWCPASSVPKLAYDHNRILSVAIDRLRARITYTTVVRHLLSSEFTLSDLQSAYESVLGHNLDKRNFRKKILALALVKETGRTRTSGASRPAGLYHFAHKGIKTIEIL